MTSVGKSAESRRCRKPQLLGVARMSVRHLMKTVAASAGATVCAAVFMLGIGSGVAGAATSVSPDGNTTLSTIGAITAGTPYDSGQQITVTIAANTKMSAANLSTSGLPGCTSASNCSGN